MSTETRRLVRTDSPGRPPRLSHSSWTMTIGSKWHWVNKWIKNLQQKWVLLQSVKGEISVQDQLFCWESLHCVTGKLDLHQTSVVHKHTERQCDKTHFSVRPPDFLHPSPINSALYVVIMFVLVCLCRFLWQIILLTYMRSISGWFLNFRSLFSKSKPPLNLDKFSEYCIN